MCKVAIIPAIPSDKRQMAAKFIRELGKEISFGNQDGLGYAAIKDDGSMFGERWWINADAFKSVVANPLASKFGGVVKNSVTSNAHKYNSFGEGSLEDAVAITLHTRMATSGKGFANTHPFVDTERDTSVIHNGIISNDDDFDLKLSTCDSEAILVSYLNNNGGESVDNMQAIASSLYGYYVAALFSRDSQGFRILDIMKGNNDALHAMWIAELGTYVFCSSEHNVKEAAKTLGFTVGEAVSFHDGIGMRINPFTGNVIAETAFKVNPRNKICPVVHPTNNVYNYKSSSYKPTMFSGTAKKKQSLTRQEIEFMKLPPKIEAITGRVYGEDYYNSYNYSGD